MTIDPYLLGMVALAAMVVGMVIGVSLARSRR